MPLVFWRNRTPTPRPGPFCGLFHLRASKEASLHEQRPITQHFIWTTQQKTYSRSTGGRYLDDAVGQAKQSMWSAG